MNETERTNQNKKVQNNHKKLHKIKERRRKTEMRKYIISWIYINNNIVGIYANCGL